MTRVAPARFGNHKYIQRMAAATFTQAPPVQDTWYTLLEASKARIRSVRVVHTNDEAASKSISAQFTIDGIVYTHASSLASATSRYYGISPTGDALEVGSGFGITVPLFGFRKCVPVREIKMELRMTSVPGTNESMSAIAQYGGYSEVANP